MESQSLIQNVALSGLSSASSVGLLDDLIKEYLLFRGFNSSLKAFEYELKTDKEKSFRPDKITDMLLSYIHQYDLASLLDLWTFLDQKYFARISLKIGSSHAISRKYELFLMRYYLVHAVQTNKTEKALEFFENYVAKIQSQNEWKEWFCLPFTKNPQDSAQFSIYFNKNWIDTFMISLQNFLAIVFHSLQMPRLLNYQEEDAFWSKYLKSSSSSTDFDSFEQDYLQSELNDEFEFKNQDLTSKPSGGLIGLIKNLKSTKQNRNKEVKNLSLIANELLNDESNIESSFEKLVVNCDNVGEESSNDIENQPYVTVNQEDLTEHKSSIVMIKISYDLKYFASVDLDGMIKEMYSLSRYMIDINIETLAGTTFTLKVSLHESVQSVKAKIQRHEGIPISHQHLIWQSSELEDKCSLNDYSIPNGATIRMVIAIRGGPINTRRMTTEDALLRDVSDLMEIHDDSTLWNSDSHSNKHVTLLLFRDGDHLNLLRVIDRGEANSPVSGAMSAASMYVPYDETDQDTISLANNLEDILSGATFGSTTDLNSQKSISTRPKQLKLLSKRKKSSSTENLKTKEKMMLIKQKLKLKADKIGEDKKSETEEQKADSAKKKNRTSKKSGCVAANQNRENEETGEIEANEVDDDEISDDEYADEYLDDDEDYDEDDDDQDDDDEEEYDDDEEDNHYYPNLSHSSENNNHNTNISNSNLETDFAPDDEDYDDEDELILNKSECLLNEDQQPSASPTQNRIPSSLATTALPTLNTPTDTEHFQTPYSGRINKNGLLSSKLEYLKNRRKVDSKVAKGEHEQELNQENKTIRIRRRKNEENDAKSTRKQRSKRYEIASFSPTTIYVKTVNLDRKKSIQKSMTEKTNDKDTDRIVSSSNKKVSFSVNDDRQTDYKLNSNKKPLSKLDSLYSKSNIEKETITTLPDKKHNQLNPILKSANRLEMLKTNLTNSASILKPYQPNQILAPVIDKNCDRVYSAAKQKQLSLSANDLAQPSKSSIKLPPVVTSTNVSQSANDPNILIAGSSNNLNSMGLNEVKKKVNDLSRYCYYCKKKTGLASSYMCRCGNNYCTQHRNAEAHSCTYDYKTEGRKLIEQSNPLVAAPKLPKI